MYGKRDAFRFYNSGDSHGRVIVLAVFVKFRSKGLTPFGPKGLERGFVYTMTKNMKKIFILVPLVILLGFVGVYFLFPEMMFNLLRNAERSAAGLKQHNIDVNGLRIEYLKGGKGDPLVLLHGFGANSEGWMSERGISQRRALYVEKVSI